MLFTREFSSRWQLKITKWPNQMLESFLCDIANSFDSKFFLEYYSSDFFLLNIKDTIRIERNFPFRHVGAVRIANEFEQDAWKLFHAFLQISNSSILSEFLSKIKNAPLPIIPLRGINRWLHSTRIIVFPPRSSPFYEVNNRNSIF